MAPCPPPTKISSSGATGPGERVAPNPVTERKKAAKNVKPLKAIFKRKYISSVGQFENSGKLLGADAIADYVTAHGGTYERQVTPDTTHLICTIEEYKKKNTQGTSKALPTSSTSPFKL